MSSATYPIHIWNAVLKGKSIQPQIALYIVPDKLFHLIAAAHHGRVPVKIMESGVGTYDNNLSYATVQASSITGGYRPNYQLDTGLVCLLPEVKWEGYPPSNGQVQILYHPEQLEQFEHQHTLTQPSRQVIQKRDGWVFLALMVIVILVLTKLIYE